MTTIQKIIKYLAMALAIFLTVSIIGGILGAFSLFGFFFGDDAATGKVKTYSVSTDIHTLEVRINAADFTIKKGDVFSVESNLKNLTVEEHNGVLTVKETKKFNMSANDAMLNLSIPDSVVLERVTIVTGAGRVNVDQLCADTLNLELGAGDVKFGTLIANKDIDIEGGAGRITVSDGTLRNLDLEMGVGQLNFTAALSGDSEFNLGVGESNITVLGDKENFNLVIEKGLGSVTLDGESVSNVKNYGNGNDHIEINGGVGSIRVDFKELNAA
jgi:DUF4097 and DUF4098 domain-containing protein YvlB